MNILNSIWMALDAVRTNKVRSGLTLLSVSIGIFAIIFAGTAVTSLEETFSSEVIALGQNTFVLKRTPAITTSRKSRRKYRKRKPITYKVAKKFKEQMTLARSISLSNSSGGFTIKFANISTDPDVELIGADHAYFENNDMDVDLGRTLSDEDVTYAHPVIVLGRDVADKLFPNSSPLNTIVQIHSQKFVVVGVLEQKGTVLGQSLDNKTIIPISSYIRHFASKYSQSLEIYVKAEASELLEETIEESIGVMRIARNIRPGEENDFEVETNDSIANQFADFSKYIDIFGKATGSIALIAAGIGIMNIMLVSVKERTREIGIRKAVGAKRSAILSQFVVEAITLCQIGGIIGIALGYAGGVGLTSLINVSFFPSWELFLLSVGICTVIGLIFGIYPASKAALLDPIESLRYE